MEPKLLWALPEDLAEIQRQDPDLIDSILDTFVEQAHLSLSSIKQLMTTGDATGAAKAVHKFKGSLLQIGAPAAAAKCQALQGALQTEGAMQRSVCLGSIEAECEQLLSEIGRFRHAR